MLELIKPTYDLYLDYGRKLVADVPDERMVEQPVAGRVMNHAAWTLGHLAWVNDGVQAMLGRPRLFGEEWKPLFGPGSKPVSERGAYPSKDVLVKALEDAHRALGEAAYGASAEALGAASPERLRGRFPTVGALVAGIMTGHYGSHLGQLSAWRRAMGLASVF